MSDNYDPLNNNENDQAVSDDQQNTAGGGNPWQQDQGSAQQSGAQQSSTQQGGGYSNSWSDGGQSSGSGWNQNSFGYNYQNGAPRDPGYYKPPYNDGFAIASLVLGIISLVFFCACCNIITAILAVVFGIIHITRTDKRRGMAIAGIVTASLSVILGVVSWVLLTTNVNFMNSFRGDVEDIIPYFENEDSYDDFLDDYLEDYGIKEDDSTY